MSAEFSLSNAVILLSRDGMGYADPALQHRLIETYLKRLLEHDSLPRAICCYADGVKLVVKGSPFLDLFARLERKGVLIHVCSTCLDHYGLRDELRAGHVACMTDILEAQSNADKVITL